MASKALFISFGNNLLTISICVSIVFAPYLSMASNSYIQRPLPPTSVLFIDRNAEDSSFIESADFFTSNDESAVKTIQSDQIPYGDELVGHSYRKRLAVPGDTQIEELSSSLKYIMSLTDSEFTEDATLTKMDIENKLLLSDLMEKISSHPSRYGIKVARDSSTLPSSAFVQDPTDIPFEIIAKDVIRSSALNTGIKVGALSALMAAAISGFLKQAVDDGRAFALMVAFSLGFEVVFSGAEAFRTMKKLYLMHRLYSYLKARKISAKIKGERFDYDKSIGLFDVDRIHFDPTFENKIFNAWVMAVASGALVKMGIARSNVENILFWTFNTTNRYKAKHNLPVKFLSGLGHYAKGGAFSILTGIARFLKLVSRKQIDPKNFMSTLFSNSDVNDAKNKNQGWLRNKWIRINGYLKNIDPDLKPPQVSFKDTEAIKTLNQDPEYLKEIKSLTTQAEKNKFTGQKLKTSWLRNARGLSLKNLALTLLDMTLTGSSVYYFLYTSLSFASLSLRLTYPSSGTILQAAFDSPDKSPLNKEFLMGSRRVLYPLCFHLADATQYQSAAPAFDEVMQRRIACAKLISVFEGITDGIAEFKRELPDIYKTYIKPNKRILYSNKANNELISRAVDYPKEFRMIWMSALRSIFDLKFVPIQYFNLHYRLLTCPSCNHISINNGSVKGDLFHELTRINPIESANAMNIDRVTYILEMLQIEMVKSELTEKGEEVTEEKIFNSSPDLTRAFRNYLVHEKLKFQDLKGEREEINQDISAKEVFWKGLFEAPLSLWSQMTGNYTYGEYMSLEKLEPKYDNYKYVLKKETNQILEIGKWFKEGNQFKN